MKYQKIRGYEKINETDAAMVEKLKHSMKTNGWSGMPILVWEKYEMLITGSHRLTALTQLEEEYGDGKYSQDEKTEDIIDKLLFDTPIAVDVGHILEDYCELEEKKFYEDYGTKEVFSFDIQFDRLSQYFTGTWVEDYKEELAEW